MSHSAPSTQGVTTPPPRIGALFAGYGGLDIATSEVFGGSLAWYSEIDKGALKILGHRFPDVPNVGSVTEADWSQVEPVDILTGGSPCQDLSHAGRRAGMTEGTRSNLWVAMREAIAQLRPGLVVWENVRGALSAEAASEVEPCAGCVGDGSGVSLRALGRVVGDLSDLGYVGQWHGLRAADIGAPHGRWRVFLIAHPAGDARWVKYGDGGTPAIAGGLRRREGRGAGPGEASGGWTSTDVAGRGDAPLMPTPRATDGTKGGPNQRGSSGDLMLPSAVVTLPTPTARDWKNVGDPGKTADRMADRGQPLGEVVVNSLVPSCFCEVGHECLGCARSRSARRLIPTPTVRDWRDGGDTRANVEAKAYLGREVWNRAAWGQYAEAIERWESITRPAPSPTELNKLGNRRLSAAFSEWMMGLPAGWVTDVPGITRNEALKALGNGVVPQQAAAALRTMLAWSEVAA